MAGWMMEEWTKWNKMNERMEDEKDRKKKRKKRKKVYRWLSQDVSVFDLRWQKISFEPALHDCLVWKEREREKRNSERSEELKASNRQVPRAGTGIWFSGVHTAPCKLAQLLESHSGSSKQSHTLAAALSPIKTSSYYGKPREITPPHHVSEPWSCLTSARTPRTKGTIFSFPQTLTTKQPITDKLRAQTT